MRRIACIAAAATLAAACATQPVPSSKATPVPDSRVFARDFVQPHDGRALLVVTRDKGLRASVCTVGIHVDGTLVADLRPSEQVRLFVEEGEHLVGASSRANTCFAGADQETVTVTRAKPVLLRVSAGGGMGLVIEPSAF
jgi:hypothetical protein